MNQEDIEFIQRNQAWTAQVFNPQMTYYDSFIEKARYAAAIGKPMYLFINGKEKYPLEKLRNILDLPWRKIWILPEPFPPEPDGRPGSMPVYYQNEIAIDLLSFYWVKRRYNK